MRARRAAAIVAAVTIGAAIAACSRHDAVPPKDAAIPAPSAIADAGPPPRARRDDIVWQRARGDDPLDRARLALAVGAVALVEAVEDDGEDAPAALGALPFADDGELVLARLGKLARERAAKRPLLEAILGVAGQPRRQREALDPDGAKACGADLIALAADATLAREERAIAVSAARALAEKGFADPKAVPVDLDPDPGK